MWAGPRFPQISASPSPTAAFSPTDYWLQRSSSRTTKRLHRGTSDSGAFFGRWRATFAGGWVQFLAGQRGGPFQRVLSDARMAEDIRLLHLLLWDQSVPPTNTLYILLRVAKCNRYGRYICVKILKCCGKMWFESFALCKRYDILHLWSCSFSPTRQGSTNKNLLGGHNERQCKDYPVKVPEGKMVGQSIARVE